MYASFKMKRKMNIVAWMGIFLIIIQSIGCDSSFCRERSIRDISRRLLKFDSSNRINRHRILDKEQFKLGNSLTDTDKSTADFESGSIVPLKLTRETFRTRTFNARYIEERSISKSVIEFLPDISNDIQLSKMLAVNDGNSLKTGKATRTRYDAAMQRQFSNGRKNRLSEDRRMNRLRENIRSERLNIRREYNGAERMSSMRFGDAETRKTFKLVKWEISDFSIPSVSREISVFRRKTRSVVPKWFTFQTRVRTNVRRDTNGAEMFVRNDRYNTRNLPGLKLREISTERDTDSKLQQPRYERHLLVPKRELKIPSEGVSFGTANSRQSQKSFRTNDFRHGNMEETTDDRKNGRGLKSTPNKRLDSSRHQSIEAVVKYRQNRRALLESGRITDRIQTRRNTRNSDIESSGRNRDRMQAKSNTRNTGVENSGTIRHRIQTRSSTRNSGVESYGRIRDRTQTRSNTRRSDVESSGRIRNRIPLKSNTRTSVIESSERIQNSQRTDVLDFNKNSREVSIRINAASCQTSGKDCQMHTRRNVQNSRMGFSERMPNRLRTDVLGYTRKDREVSTRIIVLQALDNNNLNRKLRINELALNRHQDRRFSRLAGNVLTKERIRFNRDRKLSNENRQMMRSNSKENIPNDLVFRSRSIRNQDRATDNLKNRVMRNVVNVIEHKQRTARSDERFSTQFRSNVLTKGRIHFNRERKLSNENRQEMIRSSNKEIIPNDLVFRSRNIRNQDRAMDKLENGLRRNAVNVLERKQRTGRSDERFSTQFRAQVNNERSILTVHNKQSRNRYLRIRSRRISRETNLETRQFLMRLKIDLNERFVKVSGENRPPENKVSSVVNVRNTILKSSESQANKRIASNQRSERRADHMHLSRENDRRVKTEMKRYRNVDSFSRKLESRINIGRSLTSSRFRDEFKLSKLRVSSDVRREPSVRTMAQTRKEFATRVNEHQQLKISFRTVPKHLISTQKLHSSTTNSTSNSYAHDYPASNFREIVSSKKPSVSTDRTKKLHRSTTASKSSSSNKSFMDFYEYISEKRSNFISLILNVMLGLAVIIASSNDKNKGIIPRRLTPFVDGFLKYTTVS